MCEDEGSTSRLNLNFWHTVNRFGGFYLRHSKLQKQGGGNKTNQQGARKHQKQVQGIC